MVLDRCLRGCCLSAMTLLAWLALPAAAQAQNPLRELPGHYVPGVTVNVPITVSAPPGTAAAGVEEAPPSGWVTSNISHSGTWDAQSGKVKWGPFFGLSIPALLTYDVTPPGGASGAACFAGTASFDGLDQVIGGDACIPGAVPALSELGAAVFAVLVLAAGVVVTVRRARDRGAFWS